MRRPRRHAFTIVEVLVVVGVVILLMAFLLPALLGARGSASMTSSMGNMRQIATWLRLYSSDNREQVLPSQFNHHLDAFPGHPRCNPSFGDWHARGTWADILWTQNELGVFPEAAGVLLSDYRFDSPDKALYELVGDIDQNVLRSRSPNGRDVVDGTGATPFGSGAQEAGLPGYFAANNFFNDDPLSDTYNGRFTSTQIRAPSRSMYLVDSYAGEVIEDDPPPFENDISLDPFTLQVDFRYAGSCLMLFLDDHVAPMSPWANLDELEQGRQVRVRDLHRARPGPG